MSYKDDMMIFALNSNVPLAQKIADRVGVPLSKSSVERFSDGEIQINIDETVVKMSTLYNQPVSQLMTI